MSAEHAVDGHESLSETFTQLKETHITEGGLQMGKFFDGVADRGFGVVLMIMAIPGALPLPAAGYSSPFGLAMLALGYQMLKGHEKPLLPKKVTGLTIPRGAAEKMLGAAVKFLSKTEHLVKPRLRWFTDKKNRKFLSFVVLAMGFLVTLPVLATNTFPSMVIFALAVAILEEDGLLGIGALIMGVFSILLYVGLFYVLIAYGPEAIGAIKDQIKGWIGLSA